MSSGWRWILVVTGVAALDLLTRFAAHFDFGRVMHVEAVLFSVTAIVLASLLNHYPSPRPWLHAVQVSLVWLFGLGSLRPLLWTFGLPLTIANLGTLVGALSGIVVWLLRRRRRGPHEPTGSSS
jgi:hypothetical protein